MATERDRWETWGVVLANVTGIVLVLAQADGAPPGRVMWFYLHRGAYRMGRWGYRVGMWAESRYWRSL